MNLNHFKARFLIFLLMVISISCSKTDSKYVNSQIGYEITGPAGWHMYRNAEGVSFTRYNKKKYGNSSISVLIVPLNSEFQSPQDFINNVFLPQVNAVFQTGNGSGISSVEGPEIVGRNGYSWAKVKYWVSEDTYQYVYAMSSDKYVFMVTLSSTGEQHEEDDSLFQSALDTFRINE